MVFKTTAKNITVIAKKMVSLKRRFIVMAFKFSLKAINQIVRKFEEIDKIQKAAHRLRNDGFELNLCSFNNCLFIRSLTVVLVFGR